MIMAEWFIGSDQIMSKYNIRDMDTPVKNKSQFRIRMIALFILLLLFTGGAVYDRCRPTGLLEQQHAPAPARPILYVSPLLLLESRPAFGIINGKHPNDWIRKQVSKIDVINPSFEGIPSAGGVPDGWENCGSLHESPPDIQPGYFDVVQAPAHGASYLGMVVRDNETWESVGQHLSMPLKKGKKYVFSLDLARSATYESSSRASGSGVSYTTPAVLRIWGATFRGGDRRELFCQTNEIKSTQWKRYHFEFSPENQDCDYLILEVFYKCPLLFPYCGNLLIDNCSSIILTDF